MKNEIRDAVSIIIEHETEVFAIIRQNFLRAFPGYFAFPGGKVDKCDETDATFDIPMLDKLETKLARAMVREIQEELGIKIDDMILSGNVISIDKVGRALTPSFNPFRFNTHFFRVRLKSKVDFSSESFNVDTNEAFDHFWKTPKQILDIFDEGEYLMVPPIRLFLEQLKSNIDFKEEIVLVDRFNNETEVPWIEPMKDFIQVMPKSYTLPPAERTNAFIIGEESKTLIDPSPCELDELKKFENVFSRYIIDKVFLTHQHNDHYQFSNIIAKKLGVPMWMSQFTFDTISKKEAPGYFDGIVIHICKEGDIVTRWLGQDVRIYEVPGHDQGHLALAPKNLNWFIAGDLFQGVGTVVVGGAEGDMKTYFNTLQRVIDLDPKCVVPSHGIALGGTNIIQKTLKHRQMREDQVFEFYHAGKSIDEMLDLIYNGLPEVLLKLARINIESHLEKLAIENKI